MRITTHIPDPLAKGCKDYGREREKSVSSIMAEALAYYITEKRKRIGKKGPGDCR